MKKRNHRGVALVLAALAFTASSPFPVAAVPGMTAEEEARLADNLLEYEEIPGLIVTYNATVLKNRVDSQNSGMAGRDAESTAMKLESMAQIYDSMAAEAELTSGTQAAAYLMQAETLRSQANDNVSDYRTMELASEKVRQDIVKETKHLFLEYYRNRKQKAYMDQNLAFLTKAYNSAKVKRSVGAGTEIEELTALEALQKAQGNALTKAADISAGYKNLITKCGWKYDSAAEIGPEPVFDPAVILPADKDGDLAKALANSNTLKTDAVLLENAKRYGGTTEDKYRKQQANDENTVRSGFLTAYDALLLKKAAYDTKAAQYAVKAQELSLSAKQLSLGLAAPMDYARTENETNAARSAMEDAWYDLAEAKVDYDMAVEGLL